MSPVRRQPRTTVEERLRFETLIADLSSGFVHVSSAELDRQIEDAQRRICEHLGLDISALWQWSVDAPGTVTMTHLYRPLGGPPIPEPMNAADYFPWCLKLLQEGKVVFVSSMETLPPEAARDGEAWGYFGIQSNLTFPLSVGNGPTVGALGFNAMRPRDWPEHIVKRLQLVADIFANALTRRRAEEALRDSEARLSLAANSANAGLWSLNLTTREYWLSAKSRELFGFALEQRVLWDDFLAVVLPEDQPLVCGVMQEVNQSGKEGNVEFRIRGPDGTVRWMSSQGRVQVSSGRTARFLMGITLDVTPRKQVEQALRESQSTLNALINSTPDFVWSVDPVDFGLLTFNWGLKSYFELGQGIDLRPGMRPEELLPTKEGAEQWRQFYQRALREGPFTVEYVTHAQTKALVLSFNVLHQDDKVFGVSVFGRDLTDQKRAEQEAHELRAKLTHLTRVHTLGVFAGSLAHELNQPLTSILSNAQAAKRLISRPEPDLQEIEQILADIATADLRAGEVIKRLKRLFQNRSISPQPLFLNEVITEVLLLAKTDFIGRGVKVGCNLQANLLPVSADRVQLQQVLLNLMLNAADAVASNKPGTRQIQVETASREGWVRTAVRDWGGGLPASNEHLFQPFFTTKPGGLGLGLAICRNIIDTHGGRIWAEPHPERGAVFSFELPVTLPAAPA